MYMHLSGSCWLCSKTRTASYALRVPAYRPHATLLSACLDDIALGATLLFASGSSLHAYTADAQRLQLEWQKVDTCPDKASKCCI